MTAAGRVVPLRDQVAIITGASSGIGQAVARDLSRAGVRLVITGRRAERLEALASELESAVAVAGDIRAPALPPALLECALARFGRCDIVFNNAGLIELGSIGEIDLERLSDMVRVNVEAAFRVAYVVLRHFVSVGRGHLVNTSRVLGTKVRPTAGPYAATKFAIEALSEALRLELAGSHVRVSCVEPGLVMTDLHRDLAVHPKESLSIATPLQPDDVARSVRFILEQPDHVRIPRLMVLPRDHQI